MQPSPASLISPLSLTCHLQLPNGVMNGEQLRYAAEAITPYGADGCADITTRAGIQLRGISLEDAGPICEKLIAKNMSSFQTGMDSIRNLTGSPIAGQWRPGLQCMRQATKRDRLPVHMFMCSKWKPSISTQVQ